ncbi:putative Type IV methyl-directed restriction enzyme of unknown recognition sequence [Bifidobacterium magnum]|uniref:Restriction endonuclease type IV Mrr domain-containing protein n=2 Tax=Bifidobacterium magnum TaxID=1692 RepID=A0A087BEB6_9BIFI|nr:putative Type IV methyl-directed restriction enzyme of unknown recognition sequence [Bifidobacterium magnum]
MAHVGQGKTATHRNRLERELLTEIIRILRILGGSGTRREIKEEMKLSSSLVPAEKISEVKVSQGTGATYHPFDFPFNHAAKALINAGYMDERPGHILQLTTKGMNCDLDTLNADTDVYSISDPITRKRAQRKPHLSVSEPDHNYENVIMQPQTSEPHIHTEDDDEEPAATNEDPETVWRSQLHDALMKLTPQKFEEFCRALVHKMGVTIDSKIGIPASNDGGLDGLGYIRSNDDFRTTRVAIQAKRWSGNVSSPEIDKFRGAMDKFNAEYGIFITTADFTSNAQVAARQGTRIITLINGDEIANLVAKYELFVTPVITYELGDFFK